MYSPHHVAWSHMEGEKRFGQAVSRRRRASLARVLLRRCRACAQLFVHDAPAATRSGGGTVREIPLDAITGTLEPGRAREFDSSFRPLPRMRKRWLRVWVAEHSGPGLGPIEVVQVGDEYAIRDGHHRVSVAHARGAATIDAIVA
jgi:hypothetical protein